MNRTKLSPIKLVKGRVRIVTVRYSLSANSTRIDELVPRMLDDSSPYIDPDVPDDALTLQSLNDLPHVSIRPFMDALMQINFVLAGFSVNKHTTVIKRNDFQLARFPDEPDLLYEKYVVALRYECTAGISPYPLPAAAREIVTNALRSSWKSCHITHHRLEKALSSDTHLLFRLSEPNNWDTEPSSEIKLIRGRICQHETEAGAIRLPFVPIARFERKDVRPPVPDFAVATLLQRLAFMGSSEAQCSHGSSPCG